MKISVLVIAHNEERYIRNCLISLTTQTVVPAEIVVVAHNCTDRTEELVRSFPAVRLVSYTGPAGAMYARIKGFESISGELICCTDGDTVVPHTWVQKLTKHFKDPRMQAVGGPVRITGNRAYRFAVLFSFYYKFFVSFISPHQRHYAFWGANFAMRKSAYEAVGGIRPFIALAPALGLTYYPEDFYLAVVVSRIGKVGVALDATVSAPAKSTSTTDEKARIRMQIAGAKTLLRYFYSKK